MNNLIGFTVKDIVTGFKGIVTGQAIYITGCDQVSITSQCGENDTGHTMWVDINRIKINQNLDRIVLDTSVNKGACQAPSKS